MQEGNKKEIKWIVMLYDPFKCEYRTEIVDTEAEAKQFYGYMDYAGHNKVECIVPEEKWER